MLNSHSQPDHIERKTNMQAIKIVLFFTSLVIIGGVNAYEYDETTTTKPQEVEFTCPESGFVCDKCAKSYYCLDNGDGTFSYQLVEDCFANQKTCLDSTGLCTTDDNILCNQNVTEYEFQCHQHGMFPHPYQCQKYFVCPKSLVAEEHECKGFEYNPLTTFCNKKLVNGKCEPLLKPCTTFGETGPIPGHPSMYYICFQSRRISKLSPQIYKCNNDEIFVVNKCVKPNTGLNENGKCTGPGLFYKEDNCKNYSECASLGATPVNKTCPCGSKFYPGKKMCDVISCN